MCTPPLFANDFSGILRLNNGDHVLGNFAASRISEGESPTVVNWQNQGFATPFSFPFASLASATFPPPSEITATQGRFALELLNGDRLFGDIVQVGDPLTVSLTGGETSELPLAKVRQIFRWDDSRAVVFQGPGSRDDWESNGRLESWVDSQGTLETSTALATIFRDLQLPRLARVELDIAWEGKPNFVIAIGVDPESPENTWADAFHIEVWDDDVVAVWEDGSLAGVESIAKLKELGNRLQVTLKIDQANRHVMIESMRGETLTQYTLPIKTPRITQTGIYFRNIDGTLRIRSLQVLHATDPAPKSNDTAEASENTDENGVKTTVHLTNGDAFQGIWKGIEDNLWQFQAGEEERSIHADQIMVVDLDPADSDEASEPELPSLDQLQIRTFDGMRLSGRLQRIDQQSLHVIAEATQGEVTIPISSIDTIDFQASKPNVPSLRGQMRLELEGTRLHGRLLDAEPDSQPTALRFEPAGTIASVMRPNVTGKLILRPKVETTKSATELRIERLQKIRQAVQKQNGVVQAQNRQAAPIRPAAKPGVWNVFSKVFDPQANLKTVAGKPIYLKTGEVIPGKVISIDENEVTFESGMTQKTKLPREQIRAIHLNSTGSEPVIDEQERQRLLTVPRNRKNSPPTHLLIANNGDMMRCRLVTLTEEVAKVESRLETITIPRNVISQIIWLKPPLETEDENTPDTDADTEVQNADEDTSDGTVLTVQGKMHDGNRLSLVPESVINQTLIGDNFFLGPIRLPLSNCEELYFGQIDDRDNPDDPHAIWQLVNAPEPIIGDSGGGDDSLAGTRSPLVGNPAPDFKLKTLDGEPFQIADQTGRTLVLDFWATWCGPCLQAMPVIEEAVAEFDPEQVRLVAVNLQESAEDIRNTLDRIGVSPEVVMDIDGVAAGRYQANAIPQTVVIDAEGTVTRVFVGGGSKLGEQLADAIRETLGEPAEQN
ncbi:TlpA family protein disulfide reductase [Rhodopirellula sp. P2]|uniref:TlpA family protein disulfide reductase n=1 Tax=Rhodopirellula sp. P2 TaxID=2127060 RepID=UPI0023677F53|nr:TlpA disulfide reductase family protein [Rhodopirellula sp. P2]WDQ18039.1 TlpA disulfide reductase family protein [Rhodopirellula sp. P2]